MSLAGQGLLGRWRILCERRGEKYSQRVTTPCLTTGTVEPGTLCTGRTTSYLSCVEHGHITLVTRRKTPGLDNADRVKYIVRSLFPHVEPFQTSPKFLRGPARGTLHSRRTEESGWKAQGKHGARDRRVAERDPQRGDRGIRGDPPRSL